MRPGAKEWFAPSELSRIFNADLTTVRGWFKSQYGHDDALCIQGDVGRGRSFLFHRHAVLEQLRQRGVSDYEIRRRLLPSAGKILAYGSEEVMKSLAPTGAICADDEVSIGLWLGSEPIRCLVIDFAHATRTGAVLIARSLHRWGTDIPMLVGITENDYADPYCYEFDAVLPRHLIRIEFAIPTEIEKLFEPKPRHRKRESEATASV